ncbi:hypothetical protein CEXT_785531 [Caerostris extrusa]|uniref:Uncharacterized protein n=1 Tax=Caerostris extrusa TaxID=172846 RepID=A0AAV4W7D3_CAEEX|nr:hypothetical protein CEXT_785531 [Caerostris extrusa]
MIVENIEIGSVIYSNACKSYKSEKLEVTHFERFKISLISFVDLETKKFKNQKITETDSLNVLHKYTVKSWQIGKNGWMRY